MASEKAKENRLSGMIKTTKGIEINIEICYPPELLIEEKQLKIDIIDKILRYAAWNT